MQINNVDEMNNPDELRHGLLNQPESFDVHSAAASASNPLAA